MRFQTMTFYWNVKELDYDGLCCIHVTWVSIPVGKLYVDIEAIILHNPDRHTER